MVLYSWDHTLIKKISNYPDFPERLNKGWSGWISSFSVVAHLNINGGIVAPPNMIRLNPIIPSETPLNIDLIVLYEWVDTIWIKLTHSLLDQHLFAYIFAYTLE